MKLGEFVYNFIFFLFIVVCFIIGIDLVVEILKEEVVYESESDYDETEKPLSYTGNAVSVNINLQNSPSSDITVEIDGDSIVLGESPVVINAGCQYCCKEKENCVLLDNNGKMIVTIDGKELTFMLGSCPNCGRKFSIE